MDDRYQVSTTQDSWIVQSEEATVFNFETVQNESEILPTSVIPAKAGTQYNKNSTQRVVLVFFFNQRTNNKKDPFGDHWLYWVPAFAGMTDGRVI
jgi:hypothetical protein